MPRRYVVLGTDGYGRPLILRNGAQLGIDQLRGRPSGNYRLWLSHKETAQDAIRPGWTGRLVGMLRA